jgi:regulator of protease activity HflC (stomatin/prohibitin superfamily)
MEVRSASRWPTSCVRTGGAEAEQIRADADRQREVIIAEAYRDAQKIKGEGDAKASAHLRRRLRRATASSRSSTAASRPTGRASGTATT